MWPIIFPFLPPVANFGEHRAPDTNLFADGNRVYDQLDQMGADGRQSYRDFEVVDLLSPLFFGGGVSFTVAYLAQRLWPNRPRLVLLAFVPIFAGLCDLFENLSLLWLLAEYPTRHLVLANGVSAATTLKLVLGPGTMLASIVGFIVLGVKRLRRRKPAGAGAPAGPAVD